MSPADAADILKGLAGGGVALFIVWIVLAAITADRPRGGPDGAP